MLHIHNHYIYFWKFRGKESNKVVIYNLGKSAGFVHKRKQHDVPEKNDSFKVVIDIFRFQCTCN